MYLNVHAMGNDTLYLVQDNTSLLYKRNHVWVGESKNIKKQ